jgi:hypothetical protein
LEIIQRVLNRLASHGMKMLQRRDPLLNALGIEDQPGQVVHPHNSWYCMPMALASARRTRRETRLPWATRVTVGRPTPTRRLTERMVMPRENISRRIVLYLAILPA